MKQHLLLLTIYVAPLLDQDRAIHEFGSACQRWCRVQAEVPYAVRSSW